MNLPSLLTLDELEEQDERWRSIVNNLQEIWREEVESKVSRAVFTLSVEDVFEVLAEFVLKGYMDMPDSSELQELMVFVEDDLSVAVAVRNLIKNSINNYFI